MAAQRTYYFTLAGADGVQVNALRFQAERHEHGQYDGFRNAMILYRGDEVIAVVDCNYVRAWEIEDADQ